MFESLPTDVRACLDWGWSDVEPYFDELINRPVAADNIDTWLGHWSQLAGFVWELRARLALANTQDTNDTEAEARYHRFLEGIFPNAMKGNQALIEKLLASGLEPAGFEIPLRNMRTDAELFREANLPLKTAESKAGTVYNKLIGSQNVDWRGETYTPVALQPHFETPDRAVREEIYHLIAERRLQDRVAINDNWANIVKLRVEQASNAGFADYRAYHWLEMKRFEYTPENCEEFHAAIEEVVVPAANRVYEQIKANFGIESVRPWDVNNDYQLLPLPAIRSYRDVTELDEKAASIFHRVDPQLGDYFDTMRREDLLDLANRPGKSPGGYCTSFPIAGRPFIFMNAVGSSGEIRTMLHEAGHAFHVFETHRHLPYLHQRRSTSEFNEVAAMAMELLGSPYLAQNEGGYFTPEDTARWRIGHLQKIILFWPYMAVVDAFQHWVYTHPQDAMDADNCDAKWGELWDRFVPAIDWTGMEDVKVTGWHRKQHIHRYAFYYVEYGLAQLGAVQIWRNALTDQAQAVRDYRHALSLGGTRPIPELYKAAQARFAFDAPMMREAVDLLETTVGSLQASVN